MISAIILAAGSAKRMGQQKLRLDFKGKPILQWALEAALSSKLGEVICVVRELKEAQQAISIQHDKLRWIANERAHEGQSTSVIAGLKAISPQSEAALFLVGDQPLVKADLINGLIDLFSKSAALIVAPTFQGQTRNPVLFHRELFPELLKLTGDRGGRGLIERYKNNAAFLEWNEEGPFLDLDTWEDYEKLNRSR
ncbi:MAG: nucleotidyltransferase family protein [Candidatus Binatia bacterium]